MIAARFAMASATTSAIKTTFVHISNVIILKFVIHFGEEYNGCAGEKQLVVLVGLFCCNYHPFHETSSGEFLKETRTCIFNCSIFQEFWHFILYLHFYLSR